MCFEAFKPITYNRRMNKAERLVMYMLAVHADKEGNNSFPSLTYLSKITQLAPENTFKAAKTLQERGYIKKGNQSLAKNLSCHHKPPVVYDLIVEAIKRDNEIDENNGYFKINKYQKRNIDKVVLENQVLQKETCSILQKETCSILQKDTYESTPISYPNILPISLREDEIEEMKEEDIPERTREEKEEIRAQRKKEIEDNLQRAFEEEQEQERRKEQKLKKNETLINEEEPLIVQNQEQSKEENVTEDVKSQFELNREIQLLALSKMINGQMPERKEFNVPELMGEKKLKAHAGDIWASVRREIKDKENTLALEALEKAEQEKYRQERMAARKKVIPISKPVPVPVPVIRCEDWGFGKQEQKQELIPKPTNLPIDAQQIEIKGKFKKPSIDEIRIYCQERKNNIDPEAFYAFYESKGWIVGKSPMKSWKASVITWEKKEEKKNEYWENKRLGAVGRAMRNIERRTGINMNNIVI